MHIIFVPYEKNLTFEGRIQKIFSPVFCHVCIGFKEDDEVWDFSLEGFKIFSYSEYVESSDVIIDVSFTRYPTNSLDFFYDKKVNLVSHFFWLFKLNTNNQYWCTDFVSMCLNELRILQYKPKRHPKELFDILSKMYYTL